MNSEVRPISTPRVSVLMTIYNAAPFLAESLDSLVRQSFSDWELVAVENGSTDGSAAILRGLRDPRFQVTWLAANIGRTAALRQAFARARGEYIAVLDADDVAHPERLLKQASYLDAQPEVVLLGTWANYIDAGGRVIDEWSPPTEPEAILNAMGSCNPIVHSSCMYRAAAALDVGGYPPERPFAQDYALWLSLAGRGKLAVLAERLCSFRVVPGSMTRSATHRVEVARDLLNAMIEAGRRLALDREGRRRNREEIAIARVRYAAALTRSRRLLHGTAVACTALVADPLSLFNNRITRGFFSA
jgi:cellulose synthase/poly-beta-1,6-N-acetylglucosamine synthase-like glycosyltransferase